jgi:hypothetical protein
MVEWDQENGRLLIAVFEDPEKFTQCVIRKYDDLAWERYVQVVCNVARSIANIFGIDEAKVWEHFDRERQVSVPFERLDDDGFQQED